MTTKPKWDDPHAWLFYQAETVWSRDELIATIHDLAWRLDRESIEDLFQEAMRADGYFQEKETT
jgi:hypothetical protein